MAGKEDQQSANPFSFSNFVLKKEDQPRSDTEESKDLSNNHKDIDNPYSFQKFNQKSNEALKPRNKKLFIVDDVDAVGNDIFADILSTKTETTKKFKKKKENIKTTNTATDFKLPRNDLESPENDDVGHSPHNEDTVDEYTDDDDNEDGNLSSSPQADTYILPDPSSDDRELFKELQLLKIENTDLRNDLERIKKEYKEHREKSDKKVILLRTELENTRKKEAEDTQALENVVRMVEDNLQTTTARALKAESTVTKLREELKAIKENQVSISEYQKLQTEHFNLLNTIQEKSRSAAQFMRTAADKTEPHIRQLQSGIQTLRFLADQFDDIGMISELPKVNIPNS